MKIIAAVLLISSLAVAQAPNPPTGLIVQLNGQATSAVVGDDIYCTPNGTWVGPTTDGPALLPTACMLTALSNNPSPGVVHGPFTTLSALQTAINSGSCGDVYLVAAGVDLGPGKLNLPAKGCDNAHWNLIESTGVTDPRFPAEGVRLTPCSAGVASMPGRNYPCSNPANLLFSIEAVNASNAVGSVGGDHWIVLGAKVSRVPTGGIAIYNLVDLSSPAVQTNHIIFMRDWFAGIEPASLPSTSTATDTSTTRAIYLGQSNHVSVIDSYFTNFYDTTSMSANGNTDAQCVGGGVGGLANSGWGVYKFVNNHCEASGEGILLGGANGPPLTPAGCTIAVNCNLDVPTDIEVRRNYFFKPPQWNGNTTTVGGTGWPVGKNGFEMKIGARALFEGNVIENVWYSAQVGYCWSTAPKNQSGSSPLVGTAPTALTNDFTYRYNYCYNVAYGIALYQSMDLGCASCQGQGADGVSEHDNIVGDNLNLGNLSTQSAGDEMEIYAAADASNRGLNKLQNVNISHNTFVRGIRSLAIFGADSTGRLFNWTVQNNIWSFASYGFTDIGNSGGCDTPFDNTNNALGILNACVVGWTFDHDAVFNWNNTTLGKNWPTDGKGTGNFFFAGSSSIGFSNYSGGNSNFSPANYQLTTSSPLHSAGSDGRDLGADIPGLLSRIAGVRE